MLHKLKHSINECELPRQFTFPFCYQPHPLVVEASHRVIELYAERLRKAGEGKMMGVMIVRDKEGTLGYLAAYSGEMADEEGFCVPPIVDYLAPDGYFKRHEAEIIALNECIKLLETSDERLQLHRAIERQKEDGDRQIAQAKEQYRQDKERRRQMREAGNLTHEEEQALVKESQYGKAEIRRLEERLRNQIKELISQAEEIDGKIAHARQERKVKSEALQAWLFAQYDLLNGEGQKKRVDEIFDEARHSVPPSGAGDCCAPRLLQYAYQHGMKPLAMGEFWVGASSSTSLRSEGQFYPSCQKRCKPILEHMLKGLDVEENPLGRKAPDGLPIVYEDQWIVVVNKPGGLQSVPGLTQVDSVATRLQKAYPECEIAPVHRLDQHTSGLLVVAKNKDVLAAMHRQFENREVKKQYVALLEQKPKSNSGTISLPIGYDIEDSCRRTVDKENGKPSTTRYRMIGEMMGHPLVEFTPETGRTHQLRIHSAHPEGLATSIVGDGLYGTKGDKMYLCSCVIQFVHPVTADRIDLKLSQEEWFI